MLVIIYESYGMFAIYLKKNFVRNFSGAGAILAEVPMQNTNRES